jgi:ATP-dependent DNA helicase RecG
MTTSQEFQSYLAAPESARFEFKEAKGGFHFDKLIEYVVALANGGGGKIILGVTDKRPRRVVGTQAFAEPGRTEAGLFERLRRRVEIEEFAHHGQRVLFVHVPGRAPGTVWEDKGVAWSRAGDALVPMTDDQRRLIYAEAAPDFSAEICAKARLTDLDPAAIADFRARWAQKSRNDRILAWTNEQTLNDAELSVDGRLTFAALTLFGTRAAMGRHLAQDEVVFEYRSTEAAGPAQDRQEHREGFFLFHNRLWERINSRNDRQSYQDGFFRFEIPTFDEKVIREAVLNAVCHRDYRLGGSVFVRQFARRLEIISPGGFPPGITTENILDQQNPRNRRLAEAFARCGLIERAGQGMDLMFERSVLQSKPWPDFTGTASHEVRLMLQGTVTNPAFIRFLEKVGQETMASFATHDLLVLDCLQREAHLPEHLKSRLRPLVEAGVVEFAGRGRGTRYFLSRRLYEHLGDKGGYSRVRGLDRGTNKALLLKHISDNDSTGTKLEELLQVLPALSRHQVQTLVRELKRDGLIINRGATNAARWFPFPKTQ